MTHTFITEMLFLAEGLSAGSGLTLCVQGIRRSAKLTKERERDAA